MLEIQSFAVMDGLGKEEACSVVLISHTSQQSLQPAGPFYWQGNLCIHGVMKAITQTKFVCLESPFFKKKITLFIPISPNHSGLLIVEDFMSLEMMTGF